MSTLAVSAVLASVAGAQNTAPTTTVFVTSATQTVTLTFTVAGTPSLIRVGTQGVTGLDFNFVSGGTCSTTTAYSIGNTCTVMYSFTPQTPGQRFGGILLANSSGTPLAGAYISGSGAGPLVVQAPTGSQVAITPAANAAGVAIDGGGNLYESDYSSSTVRKFTAVGGVVPASPSYTNLDTSVSNACGIIVDGLGNVFAQAAGGNEIVEIPVSAGATGYGTPFNAVTGINLPCAGAVDGAGNVYYVEQNGNGSIDKLAAMGVNTGTGTFTYVSNTGLNDPQGVAVDVNGNVYGVALHGSSLNKYVYSGGVYSSATVIYTTGANGFFGLNSDPNGNLYLSLAATTPIIELLAVNGVVSSGATQVNLGSSYNQPRATAIDNYGDVYIANINAGNVTLLNRASTTGLAFGSLAVTSSTSSVITLQNNGNTTVAFSGFSTGSSTDFSYYAAGTTCSTTTPMAVGATCNVGVTFSPQATGARTATLSVTDFNPSGPSVTQSFALSGTGTVGTTTQTITFPQPTTPAAAGTSATLTATASPSNLTVTYSVISGPATVSGSTLTYAGVGTVVVEADQAGSGTYAAAAPVQRTVTVGNPQGSVGAASSPLIATVTMTTAGTLGSIYVLTTGKPNLDFAMATGGTCATGTAYAVNATCTVNYTFDALAPGQRVGAVQLVATGGTTVMGTTLLSGIGNGAAAVFPTNLATSTLSSAFNHPIAVVVDAAGDLFVADFVGNAIDEIVAVGGVIPASPTIKQLGSGFSNPVGVAVDGAGNVFVADHGNNAVKEIVAVGGVIPASPTINSFAAAGTFNQPEVVAVDSVGDVFVSDAGHSMVKEIVAVNGSIPTSNPTVNQVGGTFSYPVGVAIDSAGNVYVGEHNANAVREIVAVGGVVSNSSQVLTLGSNFVQPNDVAVDAGGNVYVTDTGHGLVKEILAVGGSIPQSNPTILTLGQGFSTPAGVAVDGAGNVYVADYNDAVEEIPVATPPTLAFGSLPISSTSAAMSATLQNVGNATLTFPAPGTGINPSISSGFAAAGATTCPSIGVGGTAGSLAAGATCVDSVTFHPTTGSIYTGSVVTTDNSLSASNNATQSIPLSGTGTLLTATFGTVSSSPSSVVYGTSQAVTFSSTVTYSGAQPTGAVTFSLNGPSYTATCTTAGSPETCTATVPAATIAALAVNSYTVTAALAADTNYNAATGTSGTFTVTQATDTVTVPSGSTTYGSPQYVVFVVTVSFTGTTAPSSNIQYHVDSGTVINQGCNGATTSPLTCTIYIENAQTLTVGAHTLYVTMPADSNYAASSGQNTLTVGKGNVSMGGTSFSPASSEPYGTSQAVTLTGSFTYPGTVAPTGAFSFTLNSVSYPGTCTGSSSPLSCTATVPAATIAALPVNSYLVTQVLATDSNYNASSVGTGTFTVSKATPTFGTVSSSPPSVVYGTSQAVTFSSTVTYSGAQPTGAVTFSLNGPSYTATCSVTSSTTELCSATVPAATIAALPGDPYNVAAALASDTNYNAATANGSFTVTQATPTVTVSAVSISSGATSTTLTATITFTQALYPNGAFTFQVDSGTTVTASCTGSTSPRICTASYTTGSLSVGSHTITGVLAADSNYVTQTAMNTLTVQGGYIWLVNATGSLTELTQAGTGVNSGAIGTAGSASTLGGAAIDGTSHVWSVSNANNALDEMTTAGGSIHALPVTGLSAPVAVAIDGEGDAWVANSGNGTVSIYGPATANLTAGANYGGSYETGVAMQTPSAIAVDFTGGVWVTSKTGNSVTHIIGGGFPTVTPIAAATAAGTQGVEP